MMMNSRLGASFSPFFSSITGGRRAVSLKSSVTLLSSASPFMYVYVQCIDRNYVQLSEKKELFESLAEEVFNEVTSSLKSFQFEIEGLQQTIHKSAVGDDDDNFAELGAHLEPAIRKRVKLKTEKTDAIKKLHRIARKSTRSAALLTVAEPETEDVSSKLGKTSSAANGKMPSLLDFHHESVSAATGEISKACMRRLPNGPESSDFKVEEIVSLFKRLESKKGTLIVDEMSGENSNLPIHSQPAEETITIKVHGISPGTSDSAVHAICALCGPLTGIARTGENTVDVSFSLKDKSDSQKILKRLNSVINDDCSWKACVESGGSSSVAESSNSDESLKLASDIEHQLNDLKEELARKKMHCDDFLQLHKTIMHLEG